MLLDNVTDDYLWFDTDRASYEAEQKRRDMEYQKQFLLHMKNFPVKPKRTKSELYTCIEDQLKDIEKLKEMRAPSIIIESYVTKLNELSKDYSLHNYIKTDQETLYKNNYNKHKAKFEFTFVPKIPDAINEAIHNNKQKEATCSNQ